MSADNHPGLYDGAPSAPRPECPFFTFVTNEEAVLHYKASPIRVHDSCRGVHCLMWRQFQVGSTMGFCGVAGSPVDFPGAR